LEVQRNYFLIRRLHSLSGVMPIGVFLVFHLTINLAARGGAAQYDALIDLMQSIPGIYLLELLVVFIPITFHALVGVWVVYTGQSNVGKYKYTRNWFYVLQRISGLYILVFASVHVWLVRLGDASFAALQDFMSEPLGLLFYALGGLFAIFHFTNGLWNFAITWGLAIGPHSQRVWSYILVAVFAVLSIIGLLVLTAFI